MDYQKFYAVTMDHHLRRRNLRASSPKKGVPYWPQSNGEVEGGNETILKIVQIARLEGKDWRKALENFLFQYRVTPYTVT